VDAVTDVSVIDLTGMVLMIDVGVVGGMVMMGIVDCFFRTSVVLVGVEVDITRSKVGRTLEGRKGRHHGQ
jgi:hypothetical protein